MCVRSVCTTRRIAFGAITSMCNTCALWHLVLVHRFIVVVKISCGCYVFVIFFARFFIPILSFTFCVLAFYKKSTLFFSIPKIPNSSQRIRITRCYFCCLSLFCHCACVCQCGVQFFSVAIFKSDKNVVIECIEFIHVVKMTIPCSV